MDLEQEIEARQHLCLVQHRHDAVHRVLLRSQAMALMDCFGAEAICTDHSVLLACCFECGDTHPSDKEP